MDSRITSERLTTNDSYDRGDVPARGYETAIIREIDGSGTEDPRDRDHLFPGSLPIGAHPRIHTSMLHTLTHTCTRTRIPARIAPSLTLLHMTANGDGRLSNAF